MSFTVLIAAVIAFLVARFLWFRLRAGKARALVTAGAALVDVRSPAEFAAGHLPDAKNVPLQDILARHDVGPRDRPVVVYCRSGTRSAAAAGALRRAGYTNVVNLGPMSAW